MVFVFVGWFFFRVRSLDQIKDLAGSVWNASPDYQVSYLICLTLFILPGVIYELWESYRERKKSVEEVPVWLRSSVQGMLILAILFFWQKKAAPFIYFQF